MNTFRFLALPALLLVSAAARCLAQEGTPPPAKPTAVLNLMTHEGVAQVQGQWRYSDTRITETDFKGPDGQPGRTYDYTPHAGGATFDDSAWAVLEPETLKNPRSTGKMCFNWYRIKLTLPEKVDGVPVTGAKVIFTVTVDDYAEVWVDGKLPRNLGQSGGSVVKGFNAPNQLEIANGATPGQTIQIAVFGINGPISDTPGNYIFLRNARLEFYPSTSTPPGATP